MTSLPKVHQTSPNEVVISCQINTAFDYVSEAIRRLGKVKQENRNQQFVKGFIRYGLHPVKIRVSLVERDQGKTTVVIQVFANINCWTIGKKNVTKRLVETLMNIDNSGYQPDRRGMHPAMLVGRIIGTVFLVLIIWIFVFPVIDDTASHITSKNIASSNTAQTLIFRNTTKPIGELLDSHPQVKNVEWKDMPVLGEGVVIATVTFSATALEVEGYDLNEIEKERQGFITIQCVDNSGMIISIESTSYVKGGNDVVCVDSAYFLEVLEKKENMAYGCWGMSPDAFVVLLQSGAL